MSKLEAENSSMRALLQSMMAENTSLKEQLASLTRGAAAAPPAFESSPKPAVLVKCLAIMHLVCCLQMCAKASLMLVVPLLSLLLEQGARVGVPVERWSASLTCAARAAAGSCTLKSACQCYSAVRSEWWHVRLRPRPRLRCC